jgi:N utilization substance protein B
VIAAHYPDAASGVIASAGEIVHGTVAAIADLDRIIGAHSQHWRVERLAVIDRLVLRIAVWELQQPSRAPRRIVLNEALELARRFSTEDAVKFVNGVLDGVCRTLDAGPASPGDNDSSSHAE